ncbi:SGNH/GDSL hydrolase family protein [Oceanobacillus manasiensis]|uniref:SGNH/GDSL hydrolase family protein n=1 Tax=Oceanobacillus manasiensis TaxID=586413 RepID=UPI0005AAE3F9|nr:SGNH/GDSL hydrolase family protein [Oceanobacillus manasiensis]
MKKILFIGDSITEWGKPEDPEDLGIGYVRLLNDYLRVTYPTTGFSVVNKGIGGNRVTDLADRWVRDVLEEKPDLVSISIGVNDVWRQLDQTDIDQVTPDMFAQVYEGLLGQLRGLEVVLMEPTIIEEDVDAVGNQMLSAYVEIVRELGAKYQAKVVPTNKAFLTYLQAGSGVALTTDGVHMNSKGNMLMAKTWLEVAGESCAKVLMNEEV